MRFIVSTSMMLAVSALAMPAQAGSISTVTGLSASQPSILTIDCAHCPPPAARVGRTDYQVPTVPSGSQTAEVVDVDGEKKLKRVESWLGGSPVVVYTSATGWATDGSTIVAGGLPAANEIDHGATTAAVDAPVEADKAPALAGFDLRLN
ncbi:plant virulence effector HPE1-like domain-containing protein [Rhizobium sp. AAP116]|uniref:plant virulence effector HPE1-like domain-containing protein n=1 Tax=Rhizobium sp. AAP116 TaxID=1523429 RepID=UPI0006BA047A|nr:plant virulence effector HPE1-like domain-containing protein [Rhizobium sp. AAP116]KPF59759.1 hypothetical protein IP85_06520 [Rhizobium sp. AAP116]